MFSWKPRKLHLAVATVQLILSSISQKTHESNRRSEQQGLPVPAAVRPVRRLGAPEGKTAEAAVAQAQKEQEEERRQAGGRILGEQTGQLTVNT